MNSSSCCLILFDVDGTLLNTDGAGRRAFHAALLEVFGTAGPIDSYSFAGKTDLQIARHLLTAAGLSDDRIAADSERLWDLYLANLREELGYKAPTVCPGIPELLERIEAQGGSLLLGLLTGNIEAGARLKIDAAGLRFDRFQVGAFGSDFEDRHRLPALAVERAAALSGRRFERKSVVIIGDTPDDIACGEELGVRTVAVATGSFSAEELAEYAPDHLFETLTDHQAVWTALTSEAGR